MSDHLHGDGVLLERGHLVGRHRVFAYDALHARVFFLSVARTGHVGGHQLLLLLLVLGNLLSAIIVIFVIEERRASSE